MAIAPLTLPKNYWETFQIEDEDLEFLYNYLLEIEMPQTPQELLRSLIKERIRIETEKLQKQLEDKGSIYLPQEQYQIGQTLKFSALAWETGTVQSIRPGNNPEYPPFQVIEVKMESGQIRQFAAGLANHALNSPIQIETSDPLLNIQHVLKVYGKDLLAQLTDILEQSSDLVQIAGRWFPRALLVDVNIGYLNLAEAVLEMENGGPLTTQTILSQIELPTDVNPKLTEFSFNLALQEDGRFDEVGAAGEILWFLHRLEPESVQSQPQWLNYTPISYETAPIQNLLQSIDVETFDEIEPSNQCCEEEVQQVTVTLIYPHWRSGTLPLTNRLAHLFPTAYQSPRIKFTFVDGETGQKFPGWVVRPYRYVYGLREWYMANNVLTGSMIHIRRTAIPGEILIEANKKRPTRDWVRTALVGTDGGVVFTMLKQQIATTLDERMGFVIPNYEGLDLTWEQSRKITLEQLVLQLMRELGKLNPQGNVHAQELYAAVNIMRRCPPGPILSLLTHRPWATHLGDLYFQLQEESREFTT